MKLRLLMIAVLIVAGIGLISWKVDLRTFGQDAPDVVYPSPVGEITLPTVNGTAGTLGVDYQLARLEFGFASNVPIVGDLAGDTGNGFSDRYDFENLNAFGIPQAANEVGDRDSLDPANAVLIGGMIKNPGFRFVHIGTQPFVWRVGEQNDRVHAQEVTVFTSIDHLFDPEIPGYGPNRMNPPPGGLGNVLLEACEFTVFGTNDLAEAEVAARTMGYFGRGGTGVLPSNGKWFRASLTKVFAEGFKDFNGKSPFDPAADGSMPSAQESDDFASQWEFRDQNGNPVPVKYVAVYANRTRDEKFYRADRFGNIPGNLAQSNEAEIDAVGYKAVILPERAEISGRVIDDKNGNSRIDPDEQPIPGVTVSLTQNGNVIATTTTNAGGAYEFKEVLPGSYRVVETNLPGYIDTGVLPGDGNVAIDVNTIAAALVAGQKSTENNFLDAIPPQPPARVCTPACYNSVDMWIIFDFARQAVYDQAGGIGNIFILSLNRGAMSDDEVLNALMGMDTPQARLEAQFVAAQLNAASYPQSVFNRATCFYNGPNVFVKIPGDPRLIDLLVQARAIYGTGDDMEVEMLALNLELFNNITATMGILCPFADP